MSELSPKLEILSTFLADEPFPYVLVDANGSVLFENRSAQRLGAALHLAIYLGTAGGQTVLRDSAAQTTPIPFSFPLNGHSHKATIRRATLHGADKILVIRAADVNRMAALTRAKQAETFASLRDYEGIRSEHRFAAFFDTVRDGHAIVSQSGRFIHVNQAFAKIAKHSKEELTDYHLFDIIYAPVVQLQAQEEYPELCEISPAIFDAEVLVGETKVPVAVSIASNSATQFPEFFVIIRDLTNSKRYAEVKALNAELVLANKSLDEFNRLMSHEMRAPLSRIVSAAEVLHRGESLPGETGRYIKIIDDAARDALLQYSSILSLSRGGKRVLVPLEPENLHHKIMRQHELSAEQKGITLYGAVVGLKGTERSPLPVDASDAFLILSNLISNAIKHTGEGGTVRFSITVNRTKSLVQLEVSDTGSGIPEKLRDRIFDAFVTTERGSDIQSGIGVGLSLVKRAIENRNGKIRFVTEPDKGTQFFVELPFEDISIEDTQLDHEVHDRSKTVRLSPGDTVLLVDDDSISLELMAARLREHQLEVLTATGGLQAVRTLKEMKSLPKLMFIDRNMPDLSGMDVVRTVRRRYPEQPCFICGLTAYVDDAIINDMIDAGMDAVEQKPLNAEDLDRYLTPAQ